jgi:hypothetical protein
MVPLEAFQAECTSEAICSPFTVTAFQVWNDGKKDFQIHRGKDDKHPLHVGTAEEAHRRMEELRKGLSLFRVTDIHIEQQTGQPSKASSLQKHPVHHHKEAHPTNRALQEAPPKTDKAKAGPSPKAGPELNQAARSRADAPIQTESKTKTGQDASQTPQRPEQRAKATSFTRPEKRPLALMADAAAGLVIADTIGSAPFLLGMISAATLNPFGLYAAYKMSQALTPIQERLAEEAAERFHRAEGTAPDWFLAAGTFAMTMVPQLIGGPEEEGGILAKNATQTAGRAAGYVLQESEVALTRFSSHVGEEAATAASRAKLLASQIKGFCFAAGTRVCTPSGDAAIEALKVGDPVMSWDPRTGLPVAGHVVRLFRNVSREFVRLRVGSETILTTPGHPFWVAQQGWKQAGQLLPGDLLYSAHASRPCALGETETITREDLTFNLEVAEFHNYFVSAAGLLVHNASTIGKLWSPAAIEKAVMKLPVTQYFRDPRYRPFAERSPKVLARAFEIRLAEGIEDLDKLAGRNVSVWKVRVKATGEEVLLHDVNVPASKSGGIGYHSEPLILQQIIDKYGSIKNVDVLQIFTERIPCEGCDTILVDKVSEAPIFYIISLGGRTDPRGEALWSAWQKVLKEL